MLFAHVYYMSKGEGYYGLTRSDLRKAEDLYTSRTVLDLRTGAAKNITDDGSVDGGRHSDNIVLASKDGSGRRLVTRDYYRILSMEFFPGDGEILFVKYIPFHSAVAKVDVSSGRVTDLTDFGAADRSASVGPDASMIVYASDRNGNFDIRIMRSDGSGKPVLYENPGIEYDPRFIAEGGKVLFVSDFVAVKGPGRIGNSIYSIDTDGAHLRNRAPSAYLLDVSSDRARRIIRETNAVSDLNVAPRQALNFFAIKDTLLYTFLYFFAFKP
jgi:Tol biopolymer transport system component